MIDILKIGNRKEMRGTARLESLNTYLEIARRSIKANADKFRPGLTKELLNNEDAIANIAHDIMAADLSFNGNGTLYGYRKYVIDNSIKKYIARSTKQNKNRVVSLDRKLREYTDAGKFADTIIDTKVEDPKKSALQKELREHLNRLINSSALTQEAKTYIVEHYINDKSMMDIAQKYNVSRQNIHAVIHGGLKKMRKKAKHDAFFRV